MKAFFWPQRHAENGVFVRFGRVIHWVLAALGIAIIVIGASATAISVVRVATYQESPPPKPTPPAPDPNRQIKDAIRRADAAGDAQAAQTLRDYLKQQTSDPWGDVGEPVTFSEPADPPPYVHWEGLWIGLAFGLPLFFVGRGIRYILADE